MEQQTRTRAGGIAPPSVLRVAWLITSLEARRWYNRRPVFKKRPLGGVRSGTQRKGAPAKLLLFVLSLIFASNAITQVTRIVHGVAHEAERDVDTSTLPISQETLFHLERFEQKLEQGPPPALEHQHVVWLLEHEGSEDAWLERAEKNELGRRLVRQFDTYGHAGFRLRTVAVQPFLPADDVWFAGGDPSLMLMPLGVIGALLALGMLFLSVVGMERDLARTESTLEWHFHFPVSARGLLLSRVLGTALVSPLLWFFLLPYFSVIFGIARFGPWLGTLLGLLATLYIGLLAGSIRVAAETVLRAILPLRRVAQLQAALELLGALPMLLALAASSRAGLLFLLAQSRQLPDFALYNPLSLPLCWLLPTRQAVPAGLAAFFIALLSVHGAVALGSYMLRDGLMRSTGPLSGRRRTQARAVSASGARSLLAVVAGHELGAIVRDPGRVARVVLFPLTMIIVNGLMNPDFFRTIITSENHASAASFGLGTIVLMSGGLFTLANEGPGLWLFYTTPHSLDRVLVQKAVFWSLLSTLFTALALVALALVAGRLSFVLSPQALLALVGAALYGFIGVALGALGTDVLETERQRRVQPFTVQLFMLLSGMFIFALYVPSAWAKFAQLSLSGLFVFALGQKLRDHTPYFLDPTEAPPPRIAVADGIFAALAFFVLQGLLGLLFTKLSLAPGVSLLFAFVGAGLVVAAGSVFLFYRMHIPQLWQALGFAAPEASAARAVLMGVGAGLLGGVVAILYTQALQRIEWLHKLQQESERLDHSKEMLPWIGALAVLAAPLFEELIFRGILYRGFRRSLRPLYAALASSLVFALVHPPLAFVPVFGMAMLAATVFERSGLLLAPIMAHTTYNALVVGGALLSQQ